MDFDNGTWRSISVNFTEFRLINKDREFGVGAFLEDRWLVKNPQRVTVYGVREANQTFVLSAKATESYRKCPDVEIKNVKLNDYCEGSVKFRDMKETDRKDCKLCSRSDN